jgi:hypothetical protein
MLLGTSDFCSTLCDPCGCITMQFVYVKLYERSYMFLELRVLLFCIRPTCGNRFDVVTIPRHVSSV